MRSSKSAKYITRFAWFIRLDLINHTEYTYAVRDPGEALAAKEEVYMNAKERLDAYTAGLPVDRRPNLTIVGSMVTQFNGIGVDTYCKDYRRMEEAARLAAHELELDFIQIASDLAREAEGYGSVLEFSEKKLPTVVKYALDDISGASALRPLRAREIPRLFDLVKATELALKDGDIYPMTLAAGPMTVAGNIRGVEALLVDAIDEPEAVAQLLETVTETALDFIDELANIGARYVYIADPVASLTTPAMYEELVLPMHKKLFERMESRGIRGRLHMCGNTLRILPYSCGCGARIIDIDHAVDMSKALDIVGDSCILNGNIDPVSDVYSCDAQQTYDAMMERARQAAGRRAMFMPGCELPTDTPIANVKAIARALRDIGA